MIGRILNVVFSIQDRVDHWRTARRWARLQELGMKIGRDVHLPGSTSIDAVYCFLISIGDRTRFGPQCLVLAHDGQADEFLDAGRLGRVVIHSSCYIGARTVILPGVEIGPSTIVEANSVVSRSLPPETVCAGNPARVVCSLEQFLEEHRDNLRNAPAFPLREFGPDHLTPERRQALAAGVAGRAGYLVR